MITPDNLQDAVQLLKENYGSYAHAARKTGVSAAYFSRVSSGDLKPKDIRSEIRIKLEAGLTPKQLKLLCSTDDQCVREDEVPYGSQARKEIVDWLETLSPSQFESLRKIIEMMRE